MKLRLLLIMLGSCILITSCENKENSIHEEIKEDKYLEYVDNIDSERAMIDILTIFSIHDEVTYKEAKSTIESESSELNEIIGNENYEGKSYLNEPLIYFGNVGVDYSNISKYSEYYIELTRKEDNEFVEYIVLVRYEGSKITKYTCYESGRY